MLLILVGGEFLKRDLRLFFEKLFSEPEFRQNFANTKSAEEGYEKAKPYIEDVTFEEFKEGLTYVHNKFFNKKYRKLDGKDLTNVSGGSSDKFVQVLDALVDIGPMSLKDILV
ncbi:MAG: hypothetical protein RUMPE_01128 [Eubacteriales bacterium SKADARSKE-1]|nr:hypothetical protein [Eubacteriales bacterium SKADARSKE-1]